MDLSRLPASLKRLLGGDLKIKLIVLAGLLGMVLILISQFKSSSGDTKGQEKAPADTTTAQYTMEEYTADLENRLTALVASIDGVGEVQVMVTLENGGQTVYAQEEKSSLDRTMDTSGEEGTTVDLKHDVESSYVFVDSGYGEKQPLVTTTVPPTVQGVVIVCEGAGDVRVEADLINVVTTALHIPTTRVCVVKINID